MSLTQVLIHLLIIIIILWLLFSYLLPLIPEPNIRMIVTAIVVIIAILSLLNYIPGWRFY